jgi:hypothetical protein
MLPGAGRADGPLLTSVLRRKGTQARASGREAYGIAPPRPDRLDRSCRDLSTRLLGGPAGKRLIGSVATSETPPKTRPKIPSNYAGFLLLIEPSVGVLFNCNRIAPEVALTAPNGVCDPS